MEDRPGNEAAEEDPVLRALRAAIDSGEAEANPTGWLEEAATREFNQELAAAPNPLERLEELVEEFRVKGPRASLAAAKAARVWLATAPERQALHEAVQALPDAPPAKTNLWRRLTRRDS